MPLELHSPSRSTLALDCIRRPLQHRPRAHAWAGLAVGTDHEASWTDKPLCKKVVEKKYRIYTALGFVTHFTIHEKFKQTHFF